MVRPTFLDTIPAASILCLSLILPWALFAQTNEEPINSNDSCSKYVSEKRPSQLLFSHKPKKDQLARADRLFSQAIVITAHDHCYSVHDFADMNAGGITARTIKLATDNVWWDAGVTKFWPPPLTTKDNYKAQESDFSQFGRDAIAMARDIRGIRIVQSVSDIYDAKRTGRLGVIVSFEGGAVAKPGEISTPADRRCWAEVQHDKCMDSIGNLATKWGLREFQPYWVTDNFLKKNGSGDWQTASLNSYGTAVLKTLKDLGVLVDLSHMGPAPFDQAVDILGPTTPFIISHTSVAAVSFCEREKPDCDNYRNWTFAEIFGPRGGTFSLDEQTIETIRKHNAVIALHFMEHILSAERFSKKQDITVVDLVNEIDYLHRKHMIENVALGPDYYPADERERGNVTWAEGLRDMTELKNVAIEMIVRESERYSDEEIMDVLGLNLVRLYCRVWKSSPSVDQCHQLLDGRLTGN